MIILAPDGQSLATRHIEPMRADQVRWFCDPVALLQNVSHLWTLKLRLFCLRCWKHGLVDEVDVRWRESDGLFRVRCACAPVEGRLTLADIRRFASSTDELLHRLGWSLCCTGRCARERGVADGVEAANDPNGDTLNITCACTIRRYVMPARSGVAS